MKIHIISPILSRYGGGVYTVIKELYGSKSILVSKNIKLHLWGYKDDFCYEDCESIFANKTFILAKFRRFNKILYSSELKNELSKQLNNDIIHSHSLWQYPSVLLNQLKKNKKKFKKIISPHGMLDPWALNNNRIRKKISLYLYEKRNLNSADCIHALCEQEYRDIKKIAPNVPVAIIPNGIYLPDVNLNKEKNNSVKTVLFLGRIHPKKGIENLIRAWKDVENDGWKLIIAGVNENGHEDYLKKITRDLNLNKSIEFIGPVFGEEKQNIFLSSDVFILPSFSEGLPMAVLEAWAYKLPVIMTKECNLEIGFEKKAAIEVEHSIIDIKRGLSTIFNFTDNSLSIMGQSGYDLVKTDFTWDIVGEKMFQVYKWLNEEEDRPSFIKS